ncbi:TetR/AcrR family transcriptional regulator [Halodesulfovibrio marinisediminis]|uniref:Transcriptional regulator, TetR family n=1 Tax=Halodesulfovibrio marinisediminis DSM 17456 TaxID=1121457 RepID=A0A1N6ISU4_9BACT|nr:TetR/AcrR family transcriptional regulator [Halodesulfovibrio marinisediminis]SIO35076.1 transcriptional regulator, TetR family [Halodesulfovibrio marinisediminis DSM 17456]
MEKTLRTTPQQERAIATINSILEASKRVLLSEGYEKFTTNRVAAASGFNIGTIYRYFPDKDKIIIQLYKRRLNEAYLFLNTQIASDTTWSGIDEFFGHLLKEYIAGHSEEDHAIAVELTKATVMNQHIQELDKTHDEKVLEDLYEAIDERFKTTLEHRLIQFFLELGIHLALMVSMKPKPQRNFMTEQAVATVIAAVRAHVNQRPPTI